MLKIAIQNENSLRYIKQITFFMKKKLHSRVLYEQIFDDQFKQSDIGEFLYKKVYNTK